MTLTKYSKKIINKLQIFTDLKMKSTQKEVKELFFQTFLEKYKHNLKMKTIFT